MEWTRIDVYISFLFIYFFLDLWSLFYKQLKWAKVRTEECEAMENAT